MLWGPTVHNDLAVVSLGAKGLVAFNGQKEVAWSAVPPENYRLGFPLATEKEWFIPTAEGDVLRLDSATGQWLGKVSAGEPLSSSILVRGKELVASAADGTWIFLPLEAGS